MWAFTITHFSPGGGVRNALHYQTGLHKRQGSTPNLHFYDQFSMFRFFSANTICFMLWGKIVYWKWEMDKYALPSCFVFPQNSTNYFLIQWMDGVHTLKYKNAICILGRKIKTRQWLFGTKTSSNNNKTIKKYLHSWRFYAQLSWRVFPVFADSQPTFHR